VRPPGGPARRRPVCRWLQGGALTPRLGAQVWDHLHTLSTKYPVEGNKDGTYLTFFSIGGFIFGIINIIGNFGARSGGEGACAPPLASRHGSRTPGVAAREPHSYGDRVALHVGMFVAASVACRGRHRLQRPGLLAERHRRQAERRAHGLPAGRALLVCDSVHAGALSTPLRRHAQAPPSAAAPVPACAHRPARRRQATTLGLSALALDLPISIAESNSGAPRAGRCAPALAVCLTAVW